MLSILFFVSPTSSQEKVYETKNVFLKPNSKKNESFALPDQKNGDLMLIMSGKNSVKGVLLDNSFNEKNNIDAEPLPSKYKNFIGYNVKDDIYSILFTNDKKSKYGALRFNNKKGTFLERKLDFKLKKELYVESIVYNNNTYLLTITKRTSDLNIYKFDSNFVPEKHTVSLKEVEFAKIPGSSIISTAFSLMTRNADSYGNTVQNLSKIESHNPNIIEKTAKKVKLYQRNNIIIFSFDDNPEKTDLFYIDLDTFTISRHKAYDKVSKERKKYKKHNSYLFDDKLFQIASSNEIMSFRILDLKTDRTLKEFIVKKMDSITFKNSAIIQEKKGKKSFGIEIGKTKDSLGIKIDKIREYEKTSKFLKNISVANLGIAVYNVDGLYNVVLGGTKEYITDKGLIIAAVLTGGALLASGDGLYTIPNRADPTYTHFNSTLGNYYSYNAVQNATKSTYINCLFDQNLKHVDGQVPLNTFDRIKDFEKTLDKPRAVNIFNYKNKIYYNYLDKDNGQFQLFKFE